jgi:hypothetical protein
VLAGVDRLGKQGRAQVRRRRVEEYAILAVGERGIELS